MSLRNIQTCVLKIFGLKLSLGFVYEEVKRVCQKARKINEKIRGLVKLVPVVADEVWIKVKQTSKKWSYAFLLASPKSLFICSLDHLVKRDVIKFWEYISDEFLTNLQHLVKEKGIAGMAEYWSHTLPEKGAEYQMSVGPDYFKMYIKKWPSVVILNRSKANKYP